MNDAWPLGKPKPSSKTPKPGRGRPSVSFKINVTTRVNATAAAKKNACFAPRYFQNKTAPISVKTTAVSVAPKKVTAANKFDNQPGTPSIDFMINSSPASKNPFRRKKTIKASIAAPATPIQKKLFDLDDIGIYTISITSPKEKKRILSRTASS